MPQKVACLVANPFTNDTRVLKTSRSLQAAGFAVDVVALHEPGLPESEDVEGITVRRIRVRSRSWSIWRPIQLLKYLEFVIRSVRAVWTADIIHCNDLNTLPTGVIAKLLGRKPKIVYDCHEFESNHKPHQHPYSIKLLQILERALLPAADTVITVSESIADEYAKLYRISRPHVVMNCPYKRIVPRSSRLRDEFRIDEGRTIYLYQGALSPGRGIETLIDHFSDESQGRALILMGYGLLAADVQVAAQKSENVFFKPAVSPDQILDYTASADVGFCMIEDVCLSYRYCLPNKLFEFVMAGLPVIVSKLPELQRFVTQTGVGIATDWHDKESLDAAMQTVESHLKTQDKTARQARLANVIDDFCWEAQEQVLLAAYRSL